MSTDQRTALHPFATLSARTLQADAAVHAWAHLDAPEAVPASGLAEGPLAGLPFGVKDVIDVAGMPTRCGSVASDPQPAAFDAACVSQLRHAGALPIGKTVTAEYAFRRPGPTRNPYNPEHTPGGSSSGSAAAVAAGMVPFALGTQTGGSIIRPAAFCGTIGFKPSFGAVPRGGLKLTCDSLDVIGWFAHDMALTQTIANVLLPYPRLPASSRPMERAALILHTADRPLTQEAEQALLDACSRLRRLGVEVIEHPQLAHAAELAEMHAVIMEYEIARNLQPILDLYADELSEALRETIGRGLQLSAARYTAARHIQRRLRHDWNGIIGVDVDVVLTPSASGPAPQGLANTGDSAFNKQWSALGWPCLHLPTTCSSQGLPLGIQLVANYEDDFRLLEAASGWHSMLKDV